MPTCFCRQVMHALFVVETFSYGIPYNAVTTNLHKELLHRYDIHIQNAGYVQGKAIIEQLSFSLPQHAIVGLIGGNGAGKSTTIQAIMHTLPYADVTHQLPTYYGYVPERPILYEYYTLREHIQLLVHTMDEEAEHLWARALQLCDTFRLTQHLDDYPIQFSKGMQQKVMLVLAFTPKHLFYIIDEP